MSPQHPLCRAIEPDLLSVAAGEAGPAAAGRVEAHVAGCGLCRDELAHYRALEGMMATLRRAPLPDDDATLARAQLASRLSDLRSRMVGFGIFPSPLGRILIGRSEQGVALVQYLPADGSLSAHVRRLLGEDAVEDRAATEGLRAELVEYLEGRRARLDWPLDLRRMRSDFQRRVLEATAALPYGAVTSYAGIAARIGAPSAVAPGRAGAALEPAPDRHPVPSGHRRLRRAHRLRGPARGAQAAPARGRGREDGRGAKRLQGGPRGHVHHGHRRQRVLRADLRLAPVPVACPRSRCSARGKAPRPPASRPAPAAGPICIRSRPSPPRRSPPFHTVPPPVSHHAKEDTQR